MKLYTEEQVKQIAKQVMNYGFHDVSDFKNYDNPIIPIELPTDEEIEKQAVWIDSFIGYQDNIKRIIIGAQWMRDKIINK